MKEDSTKNTNFREMLRYSHPRMQTFVIVPPQGEIEKALLALYLLKHVDIVK